MDDKKRKDESVESRRLKHDADSGSDGTSDAMLQKENLIDPGNEHHRNDDNKDVDHLTRHDADSGGDASGTMGAEPGEGKKE